MTNEERVAVEVEDRDGLVIACAPSGLCEAEVLVEADERRSAEAPWATYGLMICNHDRPDAPYRRHWLLTGKDD